VLLRERFSDLSEEEIKSLALYAGMTGGVMMTSDHLGELSPDRLKLWELLLSEQRASCDFPLLGRSELFYKRSEGVQPNPLRYAARAEDPVFVQVRHPSFLSKHGAILFLNTVNHTIQRTYPLSDLGISDAVYLYNWENQFPTEQTESRIAVTLPGHHSALYFFSHEPIREKPLRLSS
jgi:hypothetical protein